MSASQAASSGRRPAGDLKKYRENRAGSYYGVDIVPERIEEAKTRHRTTKCMFGAVFEVGDFAEVTAI